MEWGRTSWKRSATDSAQRKPELNAAPAHTYTDEALRIVPQDVWDAAKARQVRIIGDTETIRAARRTQRGRHAHHLLYGLFRCVK